MKKTFYATIVVLFSIMLGACTGTQRQSSLQTESGGKAVTSSIVMEIEPGIYSRAAIPQVIRLKITNNTNDAAQFGADYGIEKNIDGEWDNWDFPEHFPVIAIMYTLGPGQSETYDINLFTDLVGYEPGQYRVVKNIYVNDGNSVFTAEFEIE